MPRQPPPPPLPQPRSSVHSHLSSTSLRPLRCPPLHSSPARLLLFLFHFFRLPLYVLTFPPMRNRRLIRHFPSFEWLLSFPLHSSHYLFFPFRPLSLIFLPFHQRLPFILPLVRSTVLPFPLPPPAPPPSIRPLQARLLWQTLVFFLRALRLIPYSSLSPSMRLADTDGSSSPDSPSLYLCSSCLMLVFALLASVFVLPLASSKFPILHIRPQVFLSSWLRPQIDILPSGVPPSLSSFST